MNYVGDSNTFSVPRSRQLNISSLQWSKQTFFEPMFYHAGLDFAAKFIIHQKHEALSTLLIPAVFRKWVTYESSKWPNLPKNRPLLSGCSAHQYREGHGFESYRGLKVFLLFLFSSFFFSFFCFLFSLVTNQQFILIIIHGVRLVMPVTYPSVYT